MGRRVLIVVVLGCGALLGSASAALAADSSSITSPASPFYGFHDWSAAVPGVAFTATGTASFASNKGVLRCYWRSGINDYLTLVAGPIDTSSGSFSVPVPGNRLPPSLDTSPCQVRMVPFGDTSAHPLGDSTDLFAGPLVAPSNFFVNTNSNVPYGFEMDVSSVTAGFDFESPGQCGVTYSQVLNAVFTRGSGPFACGARLSDANDTQTTPATKSGIQVDGVDSYDPWGINDRLATTTPGFVSPSVTRSFDPATGLGTVTIKEPIMECAAGAVPYPPTTTNCPSVKSAGVELDRTYTTSSDDHIADVTDVWVSTDGHPHALNLLVQNRFVADRANDGAYRLPGQASFATPALGSMVTFPGAPGTILYKVDAQTPDAGDGASPQGAISYSPAPDGPAVVTWDNYKISASNELTFPYARTVPASGSFTMRMRFAQDFALAPVQAAAAAAVATYTPPTVAITSPAGGTTVNTSTVAVSGTVAGSVGINSVTVNGVVATLGSGGSWSATVPLTAGANTLTATALDASGASANATTSVTYVPPSGGGGGGGGSPSATVSGGASVSGTTASVRVSCQGTAGMSCTVDGLLTSTERLTGSKVVAVAARKRNSKRTVKVGTETITIAAGATAILKIPLNTLGRSLLTKFGKLPSTLSVTSSGRTVLSRHVTFKPKKRRKH